MNSKFLHLQAGSRVVCLRILGIICVAVCAFIPLSAQLGPYSCFFDTDLTDDSEYNLNSNKCDGGTGTFGVAEGRFTVNNMEGLTCNGSSGNADNELILNTISNLGDYRNITLTFEYTIRDDADGFECNSVFGNGDDLIYMDVTVDGNTKRVNVFCEDTAGNINERKRVQVAIPDGANLDVTIYAGTQTADEYFYFDRIRVCGNEVLDPANPPVDPPPPPPVAGETFVEESKGVRCKSISENLIPALMAGIYAAFNDGDWYDAEDNLITEINPSSADLVSGDNLFRYKLPNGFVSTFTLTIINDNLPNATFGPYCASSTAIDLPDEINGYTGDWQSTQFSVIAGEFNLDELQLGNNNEVAFSPQNSGCAIFFNVEVIDQFKSPTVKSCPPGVVNLLDSFPDLIKVVEEIKFEYLNDPSLDIDDTQDVDISLLSNANNEFTFIHEIPSGIGCRTSEVGLVVDANCPPQGGALSAEISISPTNGNICEGACGFITVDITGGTPPYALKFKADINVTILGFPLPVIPFPSTDVPNNSNSYEATICSAPDIGIDDIIRQNDIIFDSATNTWMIPSFITERGTIFGSVVDATGEEVDFDNSVDMQAFEKPDFPIDESDIQVCSDEIATYSDLQNVDNFDEIEWYNGDPTGTGTVITNFGSVDLNDLYGIWTNPEGCASDPTKVEFTERSVADCSTACTPPAAPEFERGELVQEWCDDGSFGGFRIKNEGFKYDWFDASTNVRIQENNLTFIPAAGVEGNFYVNAIDNNDPNCRSNNLQFSFNFYNPNITVETCQRSGTDILVDVGLSTGESILAVTPGGSATDIGGGSWRIFGMSADTDYTITIESADGCSVDKLLNIDSADCPEACNEAGDDNLSGNQIDITNGPVTIDLEDYLRNESPGGVFEDFSGNNVDQQYVFSGDITIFYVIPRVGTCPEDRAEIRLTARSVAQIDGKVCLDNVFCDEIEIVLSGDRGVGPPYSLKFRMFDAAVIDDIVFTQDDLTNDSTLVVTVCVTGNQTRYNETDKVLIIAAGTGEGNIKIEDLQDGDGNFLGTVPPIDITFSELPLVNTLSRQDICSLESAAYPINDLNDRILRNNNDIIEWWYDQPSDPNTTESSRATIPDIPINPNDPVYALVISPDGCKVEVPVEFDVIPDETVDVTYKPIYCFGETIIPDIVPTSIGIDFDWGPRDGPSSIVRSTGELRDPVIGTEYVISWETDGACPAIGEFRVTVVDAGDSRCNCPIIPLPIIANADRPAQDGLSGEGIAICFGEDDPVFMIGNNPGNYEAVWYESEAATVELFRGDNFTYDMRDRDVNYFVRFEDANGCFSNGFTATWFKKQQAERLTTGFISICLANETSVDLNSFLKDPDDFTVEWVDPLGNVIADPSNYDGAGLETNVHYTDLIQNYTDSEGCTDTENAQFIMTSYDEFEFTNFVCNAAENFYTLEFEMPSNYNVWTDPVVGKVSEAGGVWLIDSVEIGVDINLVIENNFDDCRHIEPIRAPSCNCDALPDPRTENNMDTICYDDLFAIYVPNGADYTINWYNELSGGIKIPDIIGNVFDPDIAGTYYAEIIDNNTSCVSERKPFVKRDFIPSPDRNLFEGSRIVTCEELQDSFRISNVPPEYTVQWLDAATNEVLYEGESFRPDPDDYPVDDYEFIAVYRRADGCSGGTGHRVFYRSYSRPSFGRVDTICSPDLKSVDLLVQTNGTVLAPAGAMPDGNRNFLISDIDVGTTIDIRIGRNQTEVECEIIREFEATSDFCPCPELTSPVLSRDSKTVCDDVQGFTFEVEDPNELDVIANWYDNEAASGIPLRENSLTFIPQDSGAYYVRYLDTITGCVSDSAMVELMYDSVPNAGVGEDTTTVCGMELISLDTMLIAPINPDGFWNDPDGQLVTGDINTADYPYDVPLEFGYIVIASNGQRCSDTLKTILIVKAPFDPGLEPDLINICDQKDSLINLDDLLGPRSVGYWNVHPIRTDPNVDPTINTDSLDVGDNVFTYFVEPDLVCDSESSDVRINVLPRPNVGVDTRDSICSGAEFGYSFASALDGNPEQDGIWEDVDNVLLGVDINASPGQIDLTGLAAGDYIFRYSKASGSCENSAELMLHVRAGNSAGRDTLFQICNTDNLQLNFKDIILPGATEYDLSMDGQTGIDFSVPENVDLRSLPSGEYFVRNLADSVNECEPDDALVRLVIEAAKPDPNIDGQTYSICFGDTVDLSNFLMVDGGVFYEIDVGRALSGDTLFTDRLPESSTYNLIHETIPDSVCTVLPSLFVIDLQSPPSAAGISADGSICQGDSIDLNTLLGATTDLGGVFEDIEMTGGLRGSVLHTETLAESNPLFSYIVGDAGATCEPDTAYFNVAILNTPELVDSIEFIVCLGDGSTYDLTSELISRGIDLAGEWIDPFGVGLDLTTPMSADLSTLNSLTEYNIQYALSNGMCADTMDLVFQIDESLSAGQSLNPGGNPLLHCEGEMLEVDLYSLLDNEDPNGTWFDENGDTIQTASNYELGDLAINTVSYNYKYVIRNSGLQACEDDSVSIFILVEPAPNAGADNSIKLCQTEPTYDLSQLLEFGIDQNGTFVDVNGYGNLSGSVVNTSQLTPDTYEYEYVLATNTSCDPDIAVLTIEIVTGISAGDPNMETVCLGEDYDLTRLVLNGDTGGRFEEAVSGNPITDNMISTSSYPVGELNINYIVQSANCEPDTALLILDIRSTPDLGADIIGEEFCEVEASSINLQGRLGTRPLTGQWLNPTNLAIDLSDPTNVDLSGIEPLIPAMLSYTVANAECADTIDYIFTIDPALNAGVDIDPLEHCEGRTLVLDLYEDLFPMAVDQGTWTIDGVAIPDPQDFDLKDLEARDHILTHTVENTNLGVCLPAVQTVTLTVHPAVSAGDSSMYTLCQIPSPYNLMDLIDGDADRGGVFEPISDPAGLTDSMLLTTDLAEDNTYEYRYIVDGSANCNQDTAILTLSIVAELDAGLDVSDRVCQGDLYDLQQLVMDGGGDPGGTFTNTNTGATYTYDNADLMTADLTGTQIISYDLISDNCVDDQAQYELIIDPSYNITKEENIAVGDSILIDGIWRFDEDIFVAPGMTSAGCDSTVTTVLTVSDLKVDITGESCLGNGDAMISVTISAGVPPFNLMITPILGGNGALGSTIPTLGTREFGPFDSGEHSILIIESSSGDTLYNQIDTIGVENQIIPTIEAVDASCFGDDDGSLSITEINIDGVAQDLGAYTYEWSSGDLTPSTGKLGSGFYQLTITDTISMCEFVDERLIGEPEALMVDTIITDFQCGGTLGAIELDLLSDVDDLPEFSLDGGPIQSVGLFTDLEAGFYNVTIEYGECSQTFENLEVKEASDNIIEIEPNDITLILGQEEEINVLTNFTPINVEWSSDLGLDTTSQLFPILTATETMDYIVTVTDGFNCTVTDTLRVEVIEWQDPVPDIYIPNVFNPLATNENGRFAPMVEENYPGTFEMQVFNRWGNTVYDNIQDVYAENAGWDGMYNGRPVEIGVYTYIIQFRFENGTYLKRSGDLTVVY